MCGGATLQSWAALFNGLAVRALHVRFERGHTSFVTRSGTDHHCPAHASGRTHDPWSLSNMHCQETFSLREPTRSATSQGSASTDISVRAAAPRTAAPSPNSDGSTSQPDHADES